MRTLKSLAALALAGAGVALMPTTASATTTTTYYEYVAPEDVQFIPACTPGPQNPTCDPRGPGSVLISSGTISLTQNGPAIGTITTECTTTRKVGADYYGVCVDVLDLPGTSNDITAVGEINETGLERYEPQTVAIAGCPGGTLTVQQIVYPNVFKLTVTR